MKLRSRLCPTPARQARCGPGSGLELGLDLDRSATGKAPRFWPLMLVAIGVGLLWLIGGKLVRREASNG